MPDPAAFLDATGLRSRSTDTYHSSAVAGNRALLAGRDTRSFVHFLVGRGHDHRLSAFFLFVSFARA
jgi:hypothetical protein